MKDLKQSIIETKVRVKEHMVPTYQRLIFENQITIMEALKDLGDILENSTK